MYRGFPTRWRNKFLVISSDGTVYAAKFIDEENLHCICIDPGFDSSEKRGEERVWNKKENDENIVRHLYNKQKHYIIGYDTHMYCDAEAFDFFEVLEIEMDLLIEHLYAKLTGNKKVASKYMEDTKNTTNYYKNSGKYQKVKEMLDGLMSNTWEKNLDITAYEVMKEVYYSFHKKKPLPPRYTPHEIYKKFFDEMKKYREGTLKEFSKKGYIKERK